jgi:hypothetical protein
VALDGIHDLTMLAVLTLHVHGDDGVDRGHEEQQREEQPEENARMMISRLRMAENGCPLSSSPSGGTNAARR